MTYATLLWGAPYYNSNIICTQNPILIIKDHTLQGLRALVSILLDGFRALGVWALWA